MSEAQKMLKKYFGYDSFRFHQEEIIESLLVEKDVLAIMPTGGGKSLCYQLPALLKEGVCLVVSPLISLMQDQVMGLRQNGISSCYLNSSVSPEEQNKIKKQLVSGETKLLYIAPERLLMPQTKSFLSSLPISLIAIDEAHCVSQWGHEFRKDYRRLSELKEIFPKTPIIALTATADADTRKDIVRQLNIEKAETFISTFNRPNIKYMILEREEELKQLDDFIKKNHQGETGIVYCLSRKKVERVAESLKEKGYNAVAYHAGMTPKQRSYVQKRFDREVSIIVVATIAFGMGIDRPDVRFVAHLDLPKSIEGYYQETGRAGRDGNPAEAWMIYGMSDVVKLSSMLESSEATGPYKKVARHKLDSMLSLCETTQCRRQFLLDYFGDKNKTECGNCDNCLSPAEMYDARVEAQKILSAIYRTGQTFGAGHVIDVLRGSQNEAVKQRRHDELSVHGIGKDLSKNEWNRLLRQLLNQGYVKIKDWEYKNLGLTEKSRPLLRGEIGFSVRKAVKEKEKTPSALRSKRPVETQHENMDLFEKLRHLRMDMAKEAGVPPYVIFSDKSLHDMCGLLPGKKEEMLLVHGVGETKFERYGPQFLQVISEWRSQA